MPAARVSAGRNFVPRLQSVYMKLNFVQQGFTFHVPAAERVILGVAGWLKCCSIPSDGNAGDSQGRTVARVVRSLGVGHLGHVVPRYFLPPLRSRYEVKNIIGSGSYGSVCQIPQLVCLDFF